MHYTEIDMEHYPRREHLAYFSSLPYPYVGVTCQVDVTDLVEFCKRRQYSFYLLFLHAVALAADGVRELRQRLRKGKVIEYPACPTSHTELRADGTYCYCILRHQMSLEAYISYGNRERERCRQAGSLEEDEDAESMYFVSALPWLHYTALIQPVAGGEESNPRITWGKFQEDAHGRKQLPVSLLAHHGLVDGIHIAQFYENLDKELRKLTQ